MVQSTARDTLFYRHDARFPHRLHCQSHELIRHRGATQQAGGTQTVPNSGRLTRPAGPVAKPFPIITVVFLATSRTPVRPRTHSSSCGRWSRASNGRCWSHVLDSKSGLCIRDRGCGLHVLCNGSGLYALNDNLEKLPFGCCDEYP